MGDVVFEDYSNALTNSLVMPRVIVPEGTVIAAYSMVNNKDALSPYWIYGMRPEAHVPSRGGYSMKLKAIKARNRENILKLARKWENAKEFRLSE